MASGREKLPEFRVDGFGRPRRREKGEKKIYRREKGLSCSVHVRGDDWHRRKSGMYIVRQAALSGGVCSRIKVHARNKCGVVVAMVSGARKRQVPGSKCWRGEVRD